MLAIISEILESHLWEVLMARALERTLPWKRYTQGEVMRDRVSQDRRQERDRAGAWGGTVEVMERS